MDTMPLFDDLSETWGQARNLLCVRLDALGDLLMTTPAVRALKQSCGGRRITMLTSPAGAAVTRLLPDVDDVIVYEAPWMKHTEARVNSEPEQAMAALLKERRFDGAVVFNVYSQNPMPSIFLCYLADIPLRLAHCHENPYQMLTHWVPDPEPESTLRHEVQRQLDLVARVGAKTTNRNMAMAIGTSARERVKALCLAQGLDFTQPWVVIHPGATAASRRYPVQRFAQVAETLAREDRCQIVFTGAAADADLVRELQQSVKAKSLSFVGKVDLEELAALIQSAPLLIANNSGPAHIAAAVGTAVVDLYALTNPQHTPWLVPNRVLYHDVPCRWCYKSVCPKEHNNCLSLVEPDTVVSAARELLSAQSINAGNLATSPAPFVPARARNQAPHHPIFGNGERQCTHWV